jgi:methionyl-tRNA formyltransferase
MLKESLPSYLDGSLIPQEQDHARATIVKFIDKADAEVNPVTDSIENIYLKFQAYTPWPGVFFIHNGKRVKIKSMNGAEILRVTPEGKPELDFKEYVKYHPLT